MYKNAACLGIALKYLISLLLLLSIQQKSFAWSLKTHLWIAQQILNDVADDAHVNIDGKTYLVPYAIYNALKLHPDKFRMGCLGPDVFPDPLVGQTTTHPGVQGGWQTDNWLRHLLSNAQTPEAIAFSYGFSVHASSDIFAHTYVNAYAGDIFELTDPEREVELRHFVLEKYIEGLTPVPLDNAGNPVSWTSRLSAPADFIKKTLILNDDVFKENLKAKTGFHLGAMYVAQKSVAGIQKGSQALVEEYSKWAATYYKLQNDYYGSLGTAQLNLVTAREGLRIAADLLEVKQKVLDEAKKVWENAKEIRAKYPALIDVQQNALITQTRIATELASASVRISANALDRIGSLYSKIGKLRKKISDKGCGRLPRPLRGPCNKVVRGLLGDIGGLEADIRVLNASINAAKQAAETAENLKKEINEKLKRLQKDYNAAVNGLADRTFELAIDAASANLQLQQTAVNKAREGVEKAIEVVAKAQEEVDKIDPIVDEIKKLYDKYNSLTLLMGNWVKGIDKATEEYILASERAGVKMVSGTGNPLDEYTKWLSCYGLVFTGVPIQFMEGGCFLIEELAKLKEKYDKLIERLPEWLQWVVAPTKKISELITAEAKPEMEKAFFSLTAFVTDEATAEFLNVLVNPENATLGKLNEVFREDGTTKRLLTFTDVSSVVLKDLKVENGFLNTEKFGPLRNSVTLAKLALLDPAALNQLIKNYVGEYNSPYYGSTYFRSNEPNFTILLDAVKSIDGNHQWQAFALPYPRKGGIGPGARKQNYGYNYFADGTREKGFRLWVDPYIRERVFYKLFPLSALGALGEIPELNASRYTHVECPQNPFPATQDANGNMLHQDLTCEVVSDPGLDVRAITFSTVEEYSAQFFTCPGREAEQYYTSIAAFGSLKKAELLNSSVNAKYPDIKTKLVKRGGIFKRWRLIITDCASRANAVAARDIAIRRRFAKKIKLYRVNNPSVTIKVLKKSKID